MGLGRGQFCLNHLHSTRQFNKNILDIGFLGGGDTQEAFLHKKILANLNQGDRIFGLDLKVDPRRYPKTETTEYLSTSIFDLSDEWSEHFDIVIFCEVYEHLPHPHLALHKIAQVLRPGGKLIMTYPNPLSLRPFLRYLGTGNILDPEFITKFFGDPEHMELPLPPCMIRYLDGLGLKSQELVFLKGAFSQWPLLRKFSSYIGLVAQKGPIQ